MRIHETGAYHIAIGVNGPRRAVLTFDLGCTPDRHESAVDDSNGTAVDYAGLGHFGTSLWAARRGTGHKLAGGFYDQINIHFYTAV
jgi:hypothetical protein